MQLWRIFIPAISKILINEDDIFIIFKNVQKSSSLKSIFKKVTLGSIFNGWMEYCNSMIESEFN